MIVAEISIAITMTGVPFSEATSIIANEGSVANQKVNSFKSSLGIAITCLGAAVGTGNIWRYPRIVANNTGDDGALAFLVVWLFFLFAWSIPMLLIEYGTGRYTKAASIVTFKKMVGKRAMWCGAFIGFINFGIASYYAVICGWCAYYFFYFCINPLPEAIEVSEDIFKLFAEDSSLPVAFQAIVIGLGGLCVAAGIKSIEPVMMLIVPLLIILMLISFIYSLTLPSASVGLSHLFSMDWTVFGQVSTWIDALTQNAWDTGAAQGILMVYATYLKPSDGVVKYSTTIPAINNLLSLLMACTMFSTMFSIQINLYPGITIPSILEKFLTNGPANTGLTFVWIPLLYSTLSIGRSVCVLFFLCLFLAGFSSQVSLIEASVHQLVDMHFTRGFSVAVVCVAMFLFGMCSALNLEFLVNQDFVWGFAIMIGGSYLLLMVLYFGVSKFRNTVVNNFAQNSDWKLPKVWEWFMLTVMPLQVVFLLTWWFIDKITDQNDVWYSFSNESFMTAVTQWTLVSVIFVTINLVWFRYEDNFSAWKYVNVRASNFLKMILSPESSQDGNISNISGNENFEMNINNTVDLATSLPE